jgi:hypothetical protein
LPASKNHEAVGLPKLNGVAINGDFASRRASFSSEPRAADINPIDNVAVRPDHIGAVFFHRIGEF